MKEQEQFSVSEVWTRFNEWDRKISPLLESYFQEEKRDPYCEQGYGQEMLKEIKDLTLRGGKRMRVAFAASAFSLVGGEFDEETERAILDASMGIELLQSQLLIHDDLIDKAPLRRGGKTIHKKYAEWFIENDLIGNPEEYGNYMALLGGDLTAYFACFPILESQSISTEDKLRVIDILLRSGIDTFYGQILDLLRDARGTTDEDEILKLAFVKAGRSSVEAPMQIGAILANEDSNETFSHISNYAFPFSIAAQLQDDIIGMFGKEEILGKSALSDISEGKQTLLILEAKKRANPKQSSILTNYVGKHDLITEDAAQVKEVVISTGALDYVKEKARFYANQSKLAIENWPDYWNLDDKQFFSASAEWGITRGY